VKSHDTHLSSASRRYSWLAGPIDGSQVFLSFFCHWCWSLMVGWRCIGSRRAGFEDPDGASRPCFCCLTTIVRGTTLTPWETKFLGLDALLGATLHFRMAVATLGAGGLVGVKDGIRMVGKPRPNASCHALQRNGLGFDTFRGNSLI